MLKYLCTDCRYVYNPYFGDEDAGIEPGTDFADIDESWLCPVCGSPKDIFIEYIENIHDPLDPTDLFPQEESHIPFYKEESDKVHISVGTEDEPYVQDDVHFVEFVGLFDAIGEVIEISDFPEDVTDMSFDLPSEEYEVRASCSLHGIWRGIKIN